MNFSIFDAMPPELAVRIAYKLEGKNLKAFARTCKEFNEMAKKVARQDLVESIFKELVASPFEPERIERAWKIYNEGSESSYDSNERHQKTCKAISSLYQGFSLNCTVQNDSLTIPFDKDEAYSTSDTCT